MGSWGTACVGKKSGTIQPPATHSTNSSFCLCSSSSSHWGILWLSCPNWGIIFCLSMTVTLIWPQASLLFFVRGFPHSQLSMWGNYYFGTVPQLYKDTRVIAPAEPYTQTQFINRCGRKFFFLCRRDVTFGVCGVSVREQKSLARGIQACRRISSLSRGKKRGKPWSSWLCRSISTAEFICTCFL